MSLPLLWTSLLLGCLWCQTMPFQIRPVSQLSMVSRMACVNFWHFQHCVSQPMMLSFSAVSAITGCQYARCVLNYVNLRHNPFCVLNTLLLLLLVFVFLISCFVVLICAGEDKEIVEMILELLDSRIRWVWPVYRTMFLRSICTHQYMYTPVYVHTSILYSFVCSPR